MKQLGRRDFVSGIALTTLTLAMPQAVAQAKADRRKSESAAFRIKRGYTDCRFGQLHYIVGQPQEGALDKPALVLLHQNPSSSVEFEPLVRAMATDRQVIAFDTPGSGMSDWPPEPLDMAGYAAAFSDGIESLSLAASAPVDVFGYHTGTLLAAELAIAEPQRVGRVVLSGIPYRNQEERQERLDAIAAGPKLTEDGAEILQMQSQLWNFVVTQRDPKVPLERAARIYMEKAKPMDRYWWPYISVWRYQFRERFPLIAQPVLVLQPHESLLEQSKRAAGLLQDARVVEMPDLDRDIFDTASDEIARELRRFLS